MKKEVKQYGLDIVLNKDNEYYANSGIWDRVEMEIVEAINQIGEEYNFNVVGFMLIDDVTKQYEQDDLL